jgi:hypothetical protein
MNLGPVDRAFWMVVGRFNSRNSDGSEHHTRGNRSVQRRCLLLKAIGTNSVLARFRRAGLRLRSRGFRAPARGALALVTNTQLSPHGPPFPPGSGCWWTACDCAWAKQCDSSFHVGKVSIRGFDSRPASNYAESCEQSNACQAICSNPELKAVINRRQFILTQAKYLCSPAASPLLRRHGSRLLGGLREGIVSNDNRSATKWRVSFDRKNRPQHRQRLRHNRKGDDQEHCCTFHVRGS